VPPLKKKHGRRVDVVCPTCKNIRRLTPNDALNLVTDVCFECANKRPRNTMSVVCPQCGAAREYCPSQVRSMKDGVNSLCHLCAMEKGRLVRREWLAEPRVIDARKCSVLADAMAVALETMQGDPGRFVSPMIWRRKRRRPTLRWIDAPSGKRFRLTVWCRDETLDELARIDAREIASAVLDASVWAETRCDNRNDFAWFTYVVPAAPARAIASKLGPT
jgi:hypothetical protein